MMNSDSNNSENLSGEVVPDSEDFAPHRPSKRDFPWDLSESDEEDGGLQLEEDQSGDLEEEDKSRVTKPMGIYRRPRRDVAPVSDNLPELLCHEKWETMFLPHWNDDDDEDEYPRGSAKREMLKIVLPSLFWRQSKDELLYQQANSGNIQGIKALHSDGAGLEWIDKEGKTPLIAACTNPQLFNVAKTLIELGANVNAYHPGQHNGTPLHHAAKRGLEHTVKLLLSHGANALQMNDYGQTPLDVARAKGHASVVRAIEEHVCLFSGWLRELHGPGFLELLAPQLLSRKVWVVILPIGSRKLQKPFKVELVIYSGAQDGQPRTIVPLWKANLGEPNFSQPDPVAIISNISRIPKRWRRKRAIKACQVPTCTRIKLAPLHESEKQNLQRFCNACKGIPQVMRPFFPFNNQVPSAPTVSVPTLEDEELARAINASLQSASHESPPCMDMHVGSVTYPSASPANIVNSSNHEKRYASEASASHTAYTSKFEVWEAGNPATLKSSSPISTPAAPVANAAATDDGPIQYPSLDMSPVDTSSTAVPVTSDSRQQNSEDASSSSCSVCLDAPVEGACIPCGHMAGCMLCLNEIKAKKWGCPVCRTKIDQVVRIYAV